MSAAAVTIKSYELTDVAKMLNALAALEGPLPNTIDPNPQEIAMVIEARREAIREKLRVKGIHVLRVKTDGNTDVIVDPLIDPLPQL